MKRHLNTLYITTPKTYLHRENEKIVIEVGNQKKAKIPVIGLQSVVCIGHDIMMSPSCMNLCCESKVSVVFLKMSYRLIGRVVGPQTGNILLRREQYRQTEDISKRFDIAKLIIGAKIRNSRTVLQRFCRNNPGYEFNHEIEVAIRKLMISMKKAESAGTEDALRGIEGEASKIYFNNFNHMILKNKTEFTFESRNRRPPVDPLNALLSFIYVVLYHDIVSALESVGLDPSAGFFHRDRPGRHSLALDIMEEFRSCLADRFVLTFINLNRAGKNDFKKTESGAVEMKEELIKNVIHAYEEKKREIITHPFLQEKTYIGLLPYIQAQLMSRYLRGDIDIYPPFVMR